MGKRVTGSIDRRRFVRNASLLATGSALGFSSAGCAAAEITPAIPCLTAVPVPTPVPGMTYLKASQIGCALDCDLGTGLTKTGGPATDDAPLINAAMASASAANPITFIIDGGALISGLFLPAGGYWSIAGLGCGTGFFIKSGINNDGIHNGNATAAVPSDPGPNVPLPTRGSSVSLSNFTLNGNQGNGLNGDSTTGAPQGSASKDLWYYCINLMNLNNIAVTNVVVVNSPSYHMRFSNCGGISVTGCVMNSSGANTDGLHFDGPANDIVITGCSITCNDDAIALNCPEGYTGNITGVTVADCTFNSLSLMRVYTEVQGFAQFKIDNVSVTGCTGTMSIAAFLVGTYASGSPNADVSFSVSNCQLTAPAILDITSDFSTISLTGVTLIPTAQQNVGYAFARSYFLSSNTAYTGQSITLTDCIVQRTGNYPVQALVLNYGSTIGAFEFNGFSVQDPAGSAYAAAPELLNLVSGAIGKLVIDALTSTHISSPISAGGFGSIGSVAGAGVLATRWQFPDAVMANGSPYISAATGQPSIKVGGVVQPYP